MKRFVYNKDELKFDEHKLSFWKILLVSTKYIVISLFIALIYYICFALILSTDKEKRLAAENSYLVREYGAMEEKAELIGNVVKSLEIRDKEIYSQIFNAEPPQVFSTSGRDSTSDPDYIYDETETNLVWDAHVKAIKLENEVIKVKNLIKNINDRISDDNFDVRSLPVIIPVKNFSVAQTGASVGMKINPFYKTVRMHTGIDLLSPLGTEVIAPADGTVEKTERSSKGHGNNLVINHGNGIKTVYTHLNDIYVRVGQKVERGVIIGRTGNSGITFAPNLHYEVIRDGEPVDPVNYFFADLSPSVYRDMMIIAGNTGQSMD